MSLFGMRASQMVDPSRALRGRSETMPVPERHTVLGTPLAPPYPAGTEIAEFALGCFWGEERKFWETPGVVSTSVGYEGGYTPNPTYEEVCSGRTGPRGDRPRRLRSRPGLLRRRCSRCSGSHTTRRRACARATTSAPSTVR